MGMYTHLILNVDFKPDTPKEVIDTVRYMVGDIEDMPEKQNHELFNCERWAVCLRCDSAYFMGETISSIAQHGRGWALTVNSNCKNYDCEYQKFLEYIQPYISYSEFLGFIRYEEYDHPTLIYNIDGGIRYVVPSVESHDGFWFLEEER